MLSGSRSSTARIVTERRTWSDRVGNGANASGSATIQATSSTASTENSAPTTRSSCRAGCQVTLERSRPATPTAINWPSKAKNSTQTIATGTCAAPWASARPNGLASWAPIAAPPKKPAKDSPPSSAPLRKPPTA